MKRPRYLLLSGISNPHLLFFYVFLCLIPGILPSRVVTLDSIEIFNTHEWFPGKPTVYFHCKGENKTILPDVKNTHFLYTFKGEESWQPLTELPDKKCKRCGFYERDNLKADDVFDEWELCPDDFVDGKYVHFKDNELNATFICHQCSSSAESTHSTSSNTEAKDKGKELNVILVITVSILAVVITAAGIVVGYRYWQKRKREQDQARFLKLFEEGDDIEDELALEQVL